MAAAYLCAVLAGRALAQHDTVSSASRLVLSGGIDQDDRVDFTASPVRHDGRGFNLGLEYQTRMGPLSVDALLDGGGQHLSSLAAQPASTERLVQGAFALALERPINATRSASDGFAVGLAVDASVVVTTTGYTDPDATSSSYMLALATLGPSAAWTRAWSGSVVQFRLSTPVIGLVDHPYSDLKVPSAAVDFRAASIGSLRGLTGMVSYAPTDGRRFGLTWTYRVGLVRYDDVQPVRAVSQMLTVGLVTRLGAIVR